MMIHGNKIIVSQEVISTTEVCSAGDVNLYLRCGSNAEQTVSTDDASHYQDLRVSQIENTYQTINQQ